MPALIRPWIAALLVVCVAPAVYAERPTAPKLLPESTLAYLRVHDMQDMTDAFQNSRGGQMFSDPQIKPFIDDLYNSASEAFETIENEIGLSLSELLAIPQGEACVAVVGADQGPPAFFALIQVNDNLPMAEKIVDRIIEQVEGRGGGMEAKTIEETFVTVLNRRNGGKLVIFDRDGALVVISDVDLATQILKVWNGNADKTKTLADNPHFTSIMKQCAGIQGERPQLSWFVDPVTLVKHASRGNLTMAASLAFLEPLGLNGVRGAGGSLIMRPEADFETINQMHLLLDNPRKGIVEMIALDEGDTAPEKFVPADANVYMTVNWDFEKTYKEANRILSQIRQEDDALDAEIKRSIDERAGIDFKAEVIDQLDGRVTMFNWMQPPARLNSNATFVGVKVKDSKKLKSTFEKVLQRFNVELESSTFGGVQYYRVPMGNAEANPEFPSDILRTPQPMVAFFDDYVAYLDSEELLKEVVKTSQRENASLAYSEDYQAIASKAEDYTLGEPLGMMAYSRPDEALRGFYEMARSQATKERLAQAGDNPFFNAIGGALERHELPPFDALVKYFSPTGTIVTNTETGIHWMEFALKKEE